MRNRRFTAGGFVRLLPGDPPADPAPARSLAPPRRGSDRPSPGGPPTRRNDDHGGSEAMAAAAADAQYPTPYNYGK